jgi:predicted dehydrogenase
MTTNKIQAGIAGTGFIGPAHLEALRRNNIHVTGLAESSKELAQKKADELGIPTAYASFEDMIADPQITTVHLATPNFLHYSQARSALIAGKHVVCEKPLAINSTESSELVSLANERKLVNVVNFNLRFYPLCHHARTMVRQGQLGEIRLVHGSYLQDWLLYETDWNWRLDKKIGGPLRAVADIGSHWMDMVTFITGLKINAVLADLKTFFPVRKKPAGSIDTFNGKLVKAQEYVDQPIETEDYASILLRFNNGAKGVLTVSQISAGRKNRLWLELDGSESAVSFNSERPNELWIGYREKPNEILLKDPSLLSEEAREITSYPGGHNEGYPDTFKQLYAKVYQYIREGNFDAKPGFPTFVDGHYEILLCEAIEKSASEEKWIYI